VWRTRHGALIAALGVAVGAVLFAAWTVSGGAESDVSDGGTYPASGISVAMRAQRDMPAGTHMLVRAVDGLAPRMDGRVYEVSAAGARRAGRLICKQVHTSVAGPGLCMVLSGDGYRYEGVIFDHVYERRASFGIAGVPDRARVSADGRYGAYTSFDRGSAGGYFADANDFSTDTRIVDMRSGRPILQLSDRLDITRHGRPFKRRHAQFWGVTFGHDGRFYATMATDFVHFLIEGDVHTRKARVIGRGVECPSLSPDGHRIAYKRRIRYTNEWRFHVLDLRSGSDVVLAEPHSVDDQPEWLDDERIVYSDDRDVFTVPADGSGEVERLVESAASPAALTKHHGRPG
jgi:hypothetical protein